MGRQAPRAGEQVFGESGRESGCGSAHDKEAGERRDEPSAMPTGSDRRDAVLNPGREIGPTRRPFAQASCKVGPESSSGKIAHGHFGRTASDQSVTGIRWRIRRTSRIACRRMQDCTRTRLPCALRKRREQAQQPRDIDILDIWPLVATLVNGSIGIAHPVARSITKLADSRRRRVRTAINPALSTPKQLTIRAPASDW